MSDEYPEEIYGYLKRVNNKEARPWEANFDIIDFDDGGAPWIVPLPMDRDEESRLCMICMSEGLVDKALYEDANNESDPRNYYEYVTGKGNLALLKHESRNKRNSVEDESPDSGKIVVPIWYHGEQSYSTDGENPVGVSVEEHNALKSFLDRNVALDTKTLKNKGVNNPSRVMGQLADRFPGAIRLPENKGDGYSAHVRSKAEKDV